MEKLKILLVDDQILFAESLKTFTLGNKTFDFIPAPFLHWPDSIYSYLKNDFNLRSQISELREKIYE